MSAGETDMNETKTGWAPGPWEVVDIPGGWPYVQVAPKRFVTTGGGSSDEAWANAHLIAAAPELYEALHKLALEAQGFLSMADRETHGNTNINVMALRIKEALEACALARGEK